MKTIYGNSLNKNSIVIWGTGKLMNKYIHRIDPCLNIRGFCNSYEENWGRIEFFGKECFSPDDLFAEDFVLVAIISQKEKMDVYKLLDDKGIDYCDLMEAVNAYKPIWEKTQIELSEKQYDSVDVDRKKITKFINCHIPYKMCNLACDYCYIRQSREFENYKMNLHSAEFIAKSLSPKRLGGIAFINFCAEGETMLADGLNDIIVCLIQEGHYVQIVTNGTIDRAIDDLLSRDTDLKHIFFKFSYHYRELMRTGKMEMFFENVRRVRAAGCSVSVELVASDDIIPMIEDIKAVCIKNIGALPHLTIPRDNVSKTLKLLTVLDHEQYYGVWKSFDSIMFQFKWDNMNIKRFENCMAGEWSFWMDVETGEIKKCLSNPYLDNIYDHIDKPINLEPVKNKCRLPYCYNCHAYLTLGLIEEVDAPSYYEVRNRTMEDGQNWITNEMKEIFEQKLYLNNTERKK